MKIPCFGNSCLPVLILFVMTANAQQPLYTSRAFTVYPDRVVQGRYEAKALSATHIKSNYQSPVNLKQSANISFKFAINGKDNEMAPGQDHLYTVEGVNGSAATPVITFGKQLKQPAKPNLYLQPDTKLKLRLDMREVLKQLEDKGFYTTFNGTKIYKADFKGVYVAGATLPMIWDFDNLVNNPGLQLKDTDGDGIYETELVLNAKQDQKQISDEWTLTKDISAFPLYKAPNLLANALYNMAIGEMINAVEPDSTFRTGKEWAGVWTRDISYSIILSMAYLQPQVAKNSLLRKVNKKKRIIQDTGTGGAYPASTDRMIWATAAWEVYKATGDKDWLEQAYIIIKNSIEDDIANAYDKVTGMVRGESSFLDWREQTYPKWMQPADIFESECLGTNAAHYQGNMVLSEMAVLMKEPGVAEKHAMLAQKIKTGINRYLWLQDKGYYAQFLYGRNFKTVSPRAEALGEALCVLFGIADAARAAHLVSSVPVTDFGITCIFPQIPGIPAYHNNAVWPFVQAYWAMASAKSGNEKSVVECFNNIYRPAAMFLTNKENYVADNGDFAGTQINSSNMLWSLSGNIALVHKIIFGIDFQIDKLLFHPFVPAIYKGKHLLTNFKYRGAVLDIEVEGAGNNISLFLLDGKATTKHEVPGNLQGKHTVKIILGAGRSLPAKINKVANYTTVATPTVTCTGNRLQWNTVAGASSYSILKDGKFLATTGSNSYMVVGKVNAEYQVIALDKKAVASFASEPVMIIVNSLVVEMEDHLPKASQGYPGFSGKGFVETSKTINPSLTIPVTILQPGIYAIDFTYANGNGPTNTENKCAIRSLKVNGKPAGTIILPQRGTNEWSNWGLTNAVPVFLDKGVQQITLSLEDHNDNMNGEINQAMLDNVRLIKIK
jgi:hypothetical protein